MATIIQQRRGTAAEWTAANTILANGEKGLETDGLGTTEVKEKIGNGVLAWNDLPYQESGAVASVSGDGVNNTDPKNPVLSFPTPTEINLGNVDNTSDINKPISTATQTALDLKGNQTEVSLNTAKVGITPAQTSDITANNAKVGITTQQSNDITTNNAKVGISTAQASEITANTLKETDVNHVTAELPNVENTADLDKVISTDTQTALDLKVAIATNPSKTVKGAIKAFYDATTSTLDMTIDGTDIV